MSFSRTIYPLLDAARTALLERDAMTAWRLSAVVLEAYPEHLLARHLAGLAASYMAFGEGAAASLEEAKQLYYQSGGVHLKAALAFQNQGEPELALAAFKTAALLDFHLNPALQVGFGGAFNGQVVRKAIFQGIAERANLVELLETGTHRGTTTEFMARHAGCPVKTTEIGPYYLEISRLRFDDLRAQGLPWARDIQLFAQDSRTFLSEQLSDPAPGNGNSFLYLDAHGEYLEGRDVENPLVTEVRLVRSARQHCIVMIDDFNVPDDTGYYVAEGNRIEDIAPILSSFDACFLPVPATVESGERRGCAILSGSPETTRLLAEIGELRPI